MNTWLEQLHTVLNPYPGAYSAAVTLALAILACTIGLVVRFIAQKATARIWHARGETLAIHMRVARHATDIVPLVLIIWGIATLPELHDTLATIVRHLCTALIILNAAFILSALVDLLDRVYRHHPFAVDRPIKGYLQLLKLFIYLVAFVLIIAALLNRSPVILLSGIGAMAAVLMLIFQDTILSVVAGVQLGTNDMVRIGDWIEMPSQNADGDVIEIALHTVKVQNWDKTITTLPVRKLITDSFKNWRGMTDAGGRRIKRSLFLDQHSVRFLEPDEITRFEEFVVLDDYLAQKRKEIDTWNADLTKRGAKPVNARRVTNLGTFRAYVEHYLRHHPSIHQGLTLLVRQLQPGDTGIPLEIYCFTSDIRWKQYEDIQSDIFDHLLAILPVFGLRVFQNISDNACLPAAPAFRDHPHTHKHG